MSDKYQKLAEKFIDENPILFRITLSPSSIVPIFIDWEDEIKSPADVLYYEIFHKFSFLDFSFTVLDLLSFRIEPVEIVDYFPPQYF